jgi:diaminohydroxyphosphoribosylaminopyrimidine deaminase / 5-amino-6-(5-phosphoribosylamino)uracil reductase
MADAHDLRFMQHALTLAGKAVGLASPNPPVGCLIVKDGAILGEGFHQYDLRDHAEVIALKQAGGRARGATLYVTLEPCNVAGRTGPCSEAVIAAGVSRVVAAMEDANPKVSGAGLARLREAGIAVASGVQEEEARKLNEAFSYWITTHRPLVTLKSALTLDGQLALPGKSAKRLRTGAKREWISSEESRAEVHRLRHASDALLTGIGTILSDDPLLTDRSGLPRRRRLLRVILDSRLRISPQTRIVKTANEDLLVFTGASPKTGKARKLQDLGVELVRAKVSKGKIDLNAVMKELGLREIQSVLLEAGPTLNAAALASRNAHNLILFYAPKIAGESRVPFSRSTVAGLPALRIRRFAAFGPDLMVEASLAAK